MKNSLIILILFLISCSQNPNFKRDRVEKYQTALNLYEQQKYRKSINLFKKLSLEDGNKDKNIKKIIAHSYYELGEIDSSLAILERIELDETTENIKNAIKISKLTTNSNVNEKLSFLEYINWLGKKFRMDPALILSFIEAESDFKINKKSINGSVGLLQLLPNEAQKIGLKIQEDDERLNPTKVLFHSFKYLNELIINEKFDNKHSNLFEALKNFHDSTNFSKNKINEIVDLYKKYRYNYAEHRIIDKKFSKINNESDFPFEIKEKNESIEKISPKNEKNLSPSNLNNLALIYEYNQEIEKAEKIFREAYFTSKKSKKIQLNFALFLFRRDKFQQTINYIEKFPNSSTLDPILVKAKILSYVKLNELPSALREISLHKLPKEDYFNLKGIIYFVSGNIEESISLFEKAYNYSKSPIIATNLLISIYANHSKNNEKFLVKYNKTASKTEFINPLANMRITSRYGWRPNPHYKNWKKRLSEFDFHNGLDLGAPKKTPIKAIYSGKIHLVKNYKHSGKSVFILHPNGFYSSYLHMNEILVKKGQSVKQGDIIGTVGNTGSSTAPHLHIGLFTDKWESLNPILFLP